MALSTNNNLRHGVLIPWTPSLAHTHSLRRLDQYNPTHTTLVETARRSSTKKPLKPNLSSCCPLGLYTSKMNGKAPQNGSTAAVKGASTNQTESHIPQDIAAEDTMPGNGSHQPEAADITTILHQVAGPASIPTARPQLRNQEITAENAQSFFVSDALVFIGRCVLQTLGCDVYLLK